LFDLNDAEEAIYGLEAWIAWEKNNNTGIGLFRYPIRLSPLAFFLVIKWMLSKGQGNTMGTY
ncbi:hypothetical protein S83_059992, partial [Arachis hypogaea]